MAKDGWCTIESDPGVFTELIARAGIKDVQVSEVLDLEDESMQRLQPLYGLVFLFKWDAELEQKDDRSVTSDEDLPENLFFAQQVINNACATQALLNILLNRSELDVGEALSQFREFTTGYPSALKGDLIGQLDHVKDAHNSFSRPESIEIKHEDTGDGEAFHFLGYVRAMGALWELDGLKKGPINLGPCDDDKDFVTKVRPAIQARIQRYSEKEIRFNLLALTKDRRMVLNERIEDLSAKLEEQPELLPQLEELREQLAEENRLRVDWRRENERRKHDYLPFVFNLLTALAKRDQLKGLIEAGKEDQEKRRQKRQEEAAKQKQQQQQAKQQA